MRGIPMVVFLILASAIVLPAAAVPAAAREVPVYPGAKLVTEQEPGSEPMCCDFVTSAGFEKVVVFYERALNTKGLDPRAFGARYPDLKQNAEELLRQMPPGVKIRIFPLKEHVAQGKTGVETFDLFGSPEGVRFTVFEEQLGAKDRHFAEEWARTTGATAPGGASGGPGVGAAVLKAALPQKPPAGFTRDDTGADTNAGPGYAQVAFQKRIHAGGRGPDDADVYATIEVQVNDVSDYPRDEKQRLIAPDDDERRVTVKGKYPGKEQSGTSGSECSGSKVVFLVNDRFQVEVRGGNFCGLPLFYKLIDSMDLGRLPK